MGGRASDYISAALRHRLALGVGAVLAAICAVVAVTALAGPRGLPVTGFQDASSDSPSVIDRDAHALNTVAVDGVLLQDGGGSLAPLDRSALGALRRTRADGLRAELVISNWNARLQDFAQPTATRLLTSQANIDSVARQLAALVSAQGWDGVCVDIEAMTAADGSGLAQFLQRLRTLLGHGRSLAVTVANNTTPADYVSAGYQLADLGRVVDRVILMAYDEHGPWESTPGPIGSLDWQRQGLSVLLAAVPASKVDL
jgi:spore germination protein YaaH